MAEDTWECLACGAIRTERRGDCPACGLKEGTPRSDVIRLPLGSPSTRAKTIILFPLMSWIFAIVVSIIENFAPSHEFLMVYGVAVWGPWICGYLVVGGLGLFAQTHNSRHAFHTATLRLAFLSKLIGRLLLSVVILSPFIYVTSIYGVGPLINRFVGEPFQDRSVVKGKYWSLSFGPSLTKES